MAMTNTKHKMVFETGKGYEGSEVMISGSFVETIAGVGAVALAVLGLLGRLPEVMLTIAVIAIGGAFVVQSRSIVSRFHVLVREMSDLGTDELAVRMTTEFVAGIAGMTLGVLALLGLVPGVLLPVATVVFGLTLLFGVGAQSGLRELERECGTTHETVRRLAQGVLSAGSSLPMLLGIGAITLGVLSLIGLIAPLVLTLTAALAVGSAMFFSGVAMTARMLGFTRSCEQTDHPAKA
jgi:hypothetical protein